MIEVKVDNNLVTSIDRLRILVPNYQTIARTGPQIHTWHIYIIQQGPISDMDFSLHGTASSVEAGRLLHVLTYLKP